MMHTDGSAPRFSGDAAVEQPPVSADSVLDRGGLRMLGRQPVVDGHQPRSGATREVRCETDGRGGRSDRERAAVEVEDDSFRVSARDLDVDDRDRAEAPG
jgi:hypothetical protein